MMKKKNDVKPHPLIVWFCNIYLMLRFIFFAIVVLWAVVMFVSVRAIQPGQSNAPSASTVSAFLLSLAIPGIGAFSAWVFMHKTKLQIAILDELRGINRRLDEENLDEENLADRADKADGVIG